MRRWLASLFLVAFTFGCATPRATVPAAGTSRDPSDGWIQGTMTCLEDGAIYSFRIQKKFALGGSASGGVVAIRLDDQTRLTGQYTGALNAFGSVQTETSSHIQVTPATVDTQASGTGGWQLHTANASAVLAGGGRTIQLRLLIHAGFAPHGTGEGHGNDGKHYAVQF